MTLFPCSFRPFCTSRGDAQDFLFLQTAGTGHRHRHRSVPVQSLDAGTLRTRDRSPLPVELLYVSIPFARYTERGTSSPLLSLALRIVVGRFMNLRSVWLRELRHASAVAPEACEL
ncbi:hypothetical protein BDA96_02G370500 [Sorghum bicolor]|uniref:Uncharacterized protein n=2 Tax=Sorghum bicolor TaxID=4558 RepID=A0A921UXM7_SORBI|nr:hypothetical protein BDA96_02G370500 [Sorghum bicolor]OQU90157.1 hypothetical protein SORBI_3002G353450 [Sorghum bicolor]